MGSIINFEVGQIIVITGDPTDTIPYSEHYPEGYMFKQDKVSDHLNCITDLGFNRAHGQTHYRRASPTNWRFASREEAQKYGKEPIFVGNPVNIDDYSVL